MDYSKLLASEEWQSKRHEILSRDKYLCQECNNERFFENFMSGFYENKNPNRKNIISIQEFDRIGHSGYLINPKVKEMLPEMGFIYFEINEIEECKWINIVAYREMTDIEKNEYVFKPSNELLNFYLKIEIGKIQNIDYPNTFDPNSKDKIKKTYKQIQIPINKTNWIEVKGLHIHHTYYVHGKLPWEYDEKALLTLCWKCHEDLHQGGKISVLDDSLNHICDYIYCKRCHGAGYFPEYTHIQDGICFRCNGVKFEELMSK